MSMPVFLLSAFYFFGAVLIFLLLRSKILERYFLWETIKPFLLCLFVITFIMMLDRIMDLMNIILEKQLDTVTIINLFVLSFPFIFALSVPMSVLTSSIMAFGRMSVDKELSAIKSTGINVLRMANILIVFSVMLSFGMAYFNDFVLPETNHLLKNVIVRVSYRKPITAIVPGTFTTMNNITIYAKERTDEALHDILIFNLANVRFPQTISAKTGEIYLDIETDQLKVILYDGEMHERDISEAEKYQISVFERYTFILSDLGFVETDTDSDYRGDRELTSTQIKGLITERQAEITRINEEIINLNQTILEMQETNNLLLENPEDLQNRDLRAISERDNDIRRQSMMINLRESQRTEMDKQIRRYEVEMHKKYALALACFVFMLVGIAVGMMTRTSGLGVSFTFSTIIFVVYYVLLVIGEELGDEGIVSPSLAMYLPIVLFLFIGVFLLNIARKEKHFDVSLLWNGVVRVWKKFIKPNKKIT